MANGRGALGWSSTTRSKNFTLSLDDVQELLSGCRRRPETDEVDRMACIQGIADLAFGLEAADAGRPWPARGSTTTTGRLRRSITTPSGGAMRDSA